MAALPLQAGRRRWGLGLALAVLVAVSLLAAVANASSAASKVTLRVQIEKGEGNLKGMQAFTKGFMARHPNVKFKLETITNAAKGGSNLTVVTSANAPDIAVVPNNGPAYEKLVAQGGLTDLAPVWKVAKLDKRYPASLNGQTTYKGKHYAMSLFTLYYNLLYYNADVFAKNNIQVPANHRIATTADLYAIVKALKAGGSQPLAIGAKSDYIVSWMVDALLPTSVSAKQVAGYLNSWKASVPETAKFTDAGFVKVLQQLVDYNKNGVYQDGFLGADPAAAEASFQAGQSGMVLSGSWYADVLVGAKVPFKYGWLLLPPLDPAKKMQLTSYFAIQWTIPARAKNKALAMQFLEYMVSNEGQTKSIINAQNSLPVVNSVPASAYGKLNPLVQEMRADAKTNNVQSGWTSIVPGTVGQALVNPLIQSMYADSETPDSVAQKVEAGVQKSRRAK